MILDVDVSVTALSKPSSRRLKSFSRATVLPLTSMVADEIRFLPRSSPFWTWSVWGPVIHAGTVTVAVKTFGPPEVRV